MRALRNISLQLLILFTAIMVKSSESWLANTREFAVPGMILSAILFALFDGLCVLKGDGLIMKTCHTCLANAVCDHNRFGFETCGNYIAKDVVSREDYDRRGRIIDSYALQYGTARDKYKVIIRIKREGAAEVLDEIAKRERKALPEACPVYVLTQDELDALRKKYTEGCDT